MLRSSGVVSHRVRRRAETGQSTDACTRRNVLQVHHVPLQRASGCCHVLGWTRMLPMWMGWRAVGGATGQPTAIAPSGW